MQLALAIVGGFIGFAVLHSSLCSASVKELAGITFPKPLVRCYRLAFNIFSLLTVAPLWIWSHSGDVPCENMLVRWSYAPFGEGVCDSPRTMIYELDATPLFVVQAIQSVALIAFVAIALRSYDLMDFSGLSHLWSKNFNVETESHPFTISMIHRFVRHPWYTCAITSIWANGSLHMPLLAFSFSATAYFALGSHYLEDRRLVESFGSQYAEYKKRVPGIVPLPWKWLSSAEADVLTKKRR